MEDKKGNIWIGSERDNRPAWTTNTYDGSSVSNGYWALYRYDVKSLSDKKPTITEIEREEGGIFGILEAKDGSIWFGAYGVYRYDGHSITDFKGKKVKKYPLK
jgi:hypothetical protein